MTSPKDNPSINQEDLRSAMRYWATGVSVVSTIRDNVQHGMTVNSFTSFSLDPPLIIIALEQTARTHDLIQASGVFGVTILSSLQEEISNRFAGRHTEDQDRFIGLETETLITGSPFVKGGMAYVDCRVETTHPAGKNTLFIAEVLAFQTNPDTLADGPLIYYFRKYRRLGE